MHDHELPPVYVAELDRAGVEQLIADVRDAAELLEVQVQRAIRQRVDQDEQLGLEDALRALTDGSARAIQLRYRHDGSEWWDTLTTTPGALRLVRIQHEFDGG